MATFTADQWQPKLTIDYFLTARQQIRIGFQWVGIKAREQDFYRVPATPGNLIPVDKPTGPGFRESYDFSVSQYSFQARYRWEIAPLTDLCSTGRTHASPAGDFRLEPGDRLVMVGSADRFASCALLFREPMVE